MKLILVCQAQQETTRGVEEIKRPSFCNNLFIVLRGSTIYSQIEYFHDLTFYKKNINYINEYRTKPSWSGQNIRKQSSPDPHFLSPEVWQGKSQPEKRK